MTETPQQDTDTVFNATWNEAVREIPEQGVERQREATPEERAALARSLELLAVPSFRARYRVKPSGTGRYTLDGRIEARVEQTCVVSLKPLTNEIRQDLEVSFWPPAELVPPSSGAVDIEDESDPEPIVDGRLEIGRIVFETFAAAIDPFPRSPDAELDWKPQADDDGKVSPFAALARLKK